MTNLAQAKHLDLWSGSEITGKTGQLAWDKRIMSGLKAIIVIAALLLTVGQVAAEMQAITATHTYVLGDNDSRNDARQLCFLEAKRKVLEKAGVYIQSQAEVEDLKLTKDKISSYSAALLSVEIVKEDFGSNNGQNVLTLVVKADVDITDVRKRLEAIAGDKGLQDRMDAQQRQIQQLEQQVQQLNARAAPPTESLEPPSFLGTIEVKFVPEQSAGTTNGCVLTYSAISQDHVYRKGMPTGIKGNITLRFARNRGQLGLALKIAVYDSAKPESPFFAYIQTAHGTTARSPFNQFDSPDFPGYRYFVWGMDENAAKVLTDLVASEPVTIGFNRMKDGPDVLVPLDLSVAGSTATTEAGFFIHRRSNQMLRQFVACGADMADQSLKQLGQSKSRPKR